MKEGENLHLNLFLLLIGGERENKGIKRLKNRRESLELERKRGEREWNIIEIQLYNQIERKCFQWTLNRWKNKNTKWNRGERKKRRWKHNGFSLHLSNLEVKTSHCILRSTTFREKKKERENEEWKVPRKRSKQINVTQHTMEQLQCRWCFSRLRHLLHKIKNERL